MQLSRMVNFFINVKQAYNNIIDKNEGKQYLGLCF